MNWCATHNVAFKNCNLYHEAIATAQPEEQMSFGDFETVMSIIERATEKDVEDIKEMLKNREGNLALLRVKRKINGLRKN